jgi:DNA mismatch repair ATPase MutS
MSAFDNRNNMLMGVLLNMFLFWDVLCIFRLRKWHSVYGPSINSWLETLGQWERTSSLALYSFTFAESLVTPTFENNCDLKAQDLGHPLMLTKARVDNSIELGIHDFAIITGANMAGKSTFLRTLGVNMVMAMAGAQVVSKSMKMEPRELYSSMRTSDSLQSDESYFYNELKRLHLLINSLEEKKSRFIILDEILKGTNSKDKAEGSFRFVEKLLGYDVSGVVATHDLSLCEIQTKYPDRIQNLYFDVEISNDDLSFDYTLRPGVCSNMNATFLMEKMGIV